MTSHSFPGFLVDEPDDRVHRDKVPRYVLGLDDFGAIQLFPERVEIGTLTDHVEKLLEALVVEVREDDSRQGTHPGNLVGVRMGVKV